MKDEELEEAIWEAAKEAVSSGTSGTGQATHGGAQDEEDEEDRWDQVANKIAESASSVLKYRVYVSDESEAPDDAEIHEGDRGGKYYVVQGEGWQGDDSGSFEVPVWDQDQIDNPQVAPMEGEEGEWRGDPPDEMETTEGRYEVEEDKMAEKMADLVMKEWVEDPSPNAQVMRWRNTDTGEYRYQENKPGEGSGGDGAEGGGGISPEQLSEGDEIIADGKEAVVENLYETNTGRLYVTYQEEGGDLKTVAAEHLSGVQVQPTFEEQFTEVEDGMLVDVEPASMDELQPGDEILVDGSIAEFQGSTSLGPGGGEFVRFEYEGETFRWAADSIDGRVETAYNVGDYSVDHEKAAEFADAVNTGDHVEQLTAREIVVNVGKIEDEDLVFDMLEAQVDHGFVSAEDKLRGRARAMGYSEEEIAERLGSAMPSHPEHEEFKEVMTEDNIVVENPLPISKGGVNQKAMTVVELEDGTKAYKKDYTSDDMRDEVFVDTSDDDGAQNNVMAGYGFLREVLPDGGPADVAPYKMGGGGDWIAKKEVPGKRLIKAPSEWEKKTEEKAEEVTEGFAANVLLGNNDLHYKNQMIDSEGNVYFMDLDDCQAREKGYEDRGISSVMSRMSIPKGIKNAHGGQKEAKKAIVKEASKLAKDIKESGRFDNALEAMKEEVIEGEGDEVIEDIRKTVEYFADEKYSGRYS